MMGESLQCAVILAKRESRVVARAKHKSEVSRVRTHWIPTVARMTAVGDGSVQ